MVLLYWLIQSGLLRFTFRCIKVDSSVSAQGNADKHEQLQTGILSGNFMMESLHCLKMPTQAWDRNKIKEGKRDERF